MSLRLTLTDDARLMVHGPAGERDPSPDEVALIRDALETPGLPWWIDAGAVLMGIAALMIMMRGGGK